MRYLSSAIFLALLSIGSASPETKSQLLDELIKIQGLAEVATTMKAGLVAQAKESSRLGIERLKENYPGIPIEALEKIQKSDERFAAAIDAAWSVEQALEVWKQAYGENLSEDETKKILENAKSELAAKERIAGDKALSAWREFTSQRERLTAESAGKKHSEEVTRIIEESVPPKKKD